jgi:hypothetical protein
VTSDTPWAGYRDDTVGRRLTAFADQVDRAIGDAADLRREQLFNGSWWLTPTNPEAVGVTWTDFGGELILETFGGDGGRWELDRTDEDLRFLINVVEAVIAGRVVESFAWGRSRVTVTFEDGTIDSETGAAAPRGCLPLPFWTRWGEHRQYAPYT